MGEAIQVCICRLADAVPDIQCTSLLTSMPACRYRGVATVAAVPVRPLALAYARTQQDCMPICEQEAASRPLTSVQACKLSAQLRLWRSID